MPIVLNAPGLHDHTHYTHHANHSTKKLYQRMRKMMTKPSAADVVGQDHIGALWVRLIQSSLAEIGKPNRTEKFKRSSDCKSVICSMLEVIHLNLLCACCATSRE